MNKDIWTDRQVMLDGSLFELYHYLDVTPPKVEYHQHPFYELFFFLDGNVSYSIEGKTYRLRPGDILLTNPLDIHRPEIFPGKPYERVVLWMDEHFFERLGLGGNDLAECLSTAARKEHRLIRPNQSDLIQLRKLCSRISDAQNSHEMGSDLLVWAYLIEFLVNVCRCCADSPDYFNEDITENPKVNLILNYINQNIAQDLTLDGIADEFHISKYYLIRQFKQFTGMSIYQYIIKKRVTISRDLLRSGSSVMDSCMNCGFNDYSNFLKAFKREFGCNPSKFLR